MLMTGHIIEKSDASANHATDVAVVRGELSEQQNHLLLSAIVNASDDAILSRTPDGVITSWNAAAERMFGYAPVEIIGKRKDVLLLPERADEVAAIQERLRMGIATEQFETVWLHKNGKHLDVSVTISPVKDADGNVIAASTIARDITLRKQAEEAIRQSHDRLSALVAAIPDIIFQVNREGICIDYLGDSKPNALVNKQGVVGKSLREVGAPYIGSIVHDAVDAAFATGTMQSLQYPITANDVVRHRDARVVVQSENTALVVIRDVTDSKVIEQALHESDARFRAIFDCTAVGIAMESADGHIIQANPAYEHMLGYSMQELSELSYTDITHPDDLEDSKARYQVMLDGDCDSYSFEKRYVRKDGTVLWVNVSTSAVRNADGSFQFVVVVINDLSDRKRTEAQLIQAQKMESIGRLAGGIAHDYNNLLAIILGYADLIEDGLSPDSDLVANIRNIQGAANRAASMTRQLLAFARRQPSQSMVVSPNELLMDFTRLLKPLLTSDVELVMLPGDDVGNVEIDPNHLEQIIMNLAVNSRDAMQLGGKLILKTENATFSEPHLVDWMAALPGNYVRISVTDTGIGMTDEVKQHIFEPFFTTKDSGKGTGLGLATVYGLVKQAKGFIWSHSQVGIGTTIDIYLPCVVTVQASAVKEDKVAELGGRELVLVVEDEPLVRELTVKALRKAGYSVLTAENGAEALQVFASHPAPIDLVITDAIMPIIGGRELVDRLRAYSPDISILIASGYIQEAYTDQAPLPAGVRFLQKPFTARSLLASVRQSLIS